MLEPLKTFETLASVGYTACAHHRMCVNVSGELEQVLTTCMDCGARDGNGGSLDFLREPWSL